MSRGASARRRLGPERRQPGAQPRPGGLHLQQRHQMLMLGLGACDLQLGMIVLGRDQVEQRAPTQPRPLLAGGAAQQVALLEQLADLLLAQQRRLRGVVQHPELAAALLEAGLALHARRGDPLDRG